MDRIEMYESILTSVLHCGWLDLQTLENYIKKSEDWGIYLDIDEIAENVIDLYGKLEFNEILYGIMEAIFNNLVESEKFTDNERELLYDNFSPSLNFCDSWFNNPLDEAGNTREEAIQKLKEWVKELKK